MSALKANEALWNCYTAAAQLLRDLELVGGDTKMQMAERYIATLTRHVEPLREAVDAVEREVRAKAMEAANG